MAEPQIDTAEAEHATYEELSQIELDLENVDTEILARQYVISKPIYERRAALIAKIPNFWPLVFEQAPPELDLFIQPTDSAVFAAAFTSLRVERFEVHDSLPTTTAPQLAGLAQTINAFGEPRSLRFRFEFAENEWFTDRVLEKKVWYRRAKDGWSGRVSEPVKIHWKKGKDLTAGLSDAAVELWEAQKKTGLLEAVANGASIATEEERHERMKAMPEFDKLRKMVEDNTEGSQSFFAWFAFRGRYVGEEETNAVIAAGGPEAKNGKMVTGNGAEDEQIADEDEFDYPEEGAEVFSRGEELALAIAEDVWPSALKYFADAQEDDNLEDEDFEDDDMEDDDQGDDEIVDIRGLVKSHKSGSKAADGPPTKKQRT